MPAAEPSASRLLASGFGSPRAASALSWASRVAAMLQVEGALGRAQAAVGLIPGEAAEAIVAACDADGIDIAAVAASAATASTPVIPLVRAVLAHADGPAATYLHHGATSQDVVDTAMVLCLRPALEGLEDELEAVAGALAELTDGHRSIIAVGRTLGQHAAPITYGLRFARWLGMVDRRLEVLRRARAGVMVVQLGGAVGTLGAFGAKGPEVARELAAALDLALPALPWAAERDRIGDLAAALSGVASAVAKIAGDIVLLAQSEVGEVRERAAAGTSSSAMPHKANPVDAVAARAAARLGLQACAGIAGSIGDHELERSAGAWQAEWVALPDAVVAVAGAVERLASCLQRLEVDAERAQANLDAALQLTASEPLAQRLLPHLGRSEAIRLVAALAVRVTESGRPLGEVAAADPDVRAVLTPAEIETAMDPRGALQAVDELVDHVLARRQRVAAR